MRRKKNIEANTYICIECTLKADWFIFYNFNNYCIKYVLKRWKNWVFVFCLMWPSQKQYETIRRKSYWKSSTRNEISTSNSVMNGDLYWVSRSFMHLINCNCFCLRLFMLKISVVTRRVKNFESIASGIDWHFMFAIVDETRIRTYLFKWHYFVCTDYMELSELLSMQMYIETMFLEHNWWLQMHWRNNDTMDIDDETGQNFDFMHIVWNLLSFKIELMLEKASA